MHSCNTLLQTMSPTFSGEPLDDWTEDADIANSHTLDVNALFPYELPWHRWQLWSFHLDGFFGICQRSDMLFSSTMNTIMTSMHLGMATT